jgi:hypothetical protein
LPDWLEDVRLLRGLVLFDNGRRPHFRTADGRFFDADPIDLYSYHILAYDGSALVGCVRVYPLAANGPACVSEEVLGEETFSELLANLGIQRRDTVEIGRWIVHPAYRASGRPGTLLAAASAAFATTLGNGSAVGRGMVVCAVGTGDQQDQMLARIGLTPVPAVEPITREEFNDAVRVMYCINPDQLNARFLRMMDEMARTILSEPLCEVRASE